MSVAENQRSDMEETRKSLIAMTLDYDIIQISALDKLYLVTHAEFARLERHSAMLHELVYANAMLSTIQHIFDEYLSEDEVVRRFTAWEREQARLQQPAVPSGVRPADEW